MEVVARLTECQPGENAAVTNTRCRMHDTSTIDDQPGEVVLSRVPVNRESGSSEARGTITVSVTEEAVTALWAIRRDELLTNDQLISPLFSALGCDFHFTATISLEGEIGLWLIPCCSSEDLVCDLFVVNAESGDVLATHTIWIPTSVDQAGTRFPCTIEVSNNARNTSNIVVSGGSEQLSRLKSTLRWPHES